MKNWAGITICDNKASYDRLEDEGQQTWLTTTVVFHTYSDSLRNATYLHYYRISKGPDVPGASRAEKRLRMCVDLRQRTQAQARAHSK